MSYDKQIVLLTPSFPKNEKNTIVVPPIYLLAQELKKVLPKNVKLTIVALHFPFVNLKYTCFGLDVIALGAKNCSYPKRFWYWFKLISLLKRLNKQIPIQLIHTFWLSECAFVVTYFLRLKKLKHLCTLMGQDVKTENRFLPFFRIKSPLLVPINSMQVSKLADTKHKRIFPVIQWGIEQKELNFLQEEQDIDVTFAGSFIDLKQPILFLEIIQQLVKSYPKLKVMMIGYGKLEEKIKLFISENSLGDNIVLTGKVTREEVLNYLKQSKVLLHTSNFEGGPMVFYEAWSVGCNVVSFKIGIHLDVNTAKWIKGDTKSDLLKGVIHFLENPNHQTFTPRSFADVAKDYWHCYQML